MFKKTPRFIIAFVLGLIIFLPSFFVLPKLSSAATVYHTLTVYRLTFTGNLNGGGFITSSDNGIDNAINCQSSTTGCSVQIADGSSFGLTLVPDAGSTGKFYTGALDGCYGFQLEDTTCDVELMSANISLTYGFKKNASLAPTITSVFPTVGIVGSTVTIDGANFSGIEGVLFGSVDVGMNFTALSSTRITAVVPPSATNGKITVRTTNGNAVSADTFVVTQAGNLAPKIISFSPTSGKVGDMVTITGKNLINVSWIVFSGAGNVPTTTNPSPTEITVRVPPGATTGKIIVHTIDNGDASSSTDFTVAGTTNPGTCSNGATDYPTCTPTKTGTSGTIDLSVKGGGLVPDCPSTGCGFNELMKLINTVITFLLFTLATPLFALILIYVGWLYLSAGGSSENVTKAKKILKNALIGYVIALAAWLIVKTILVTLGFQPGENAKFFDYLK